MKKSTKILASALSLVMAVGVGIGGTLAWLTAKTETVVNTFTVGDIKITLDESDAAGTGSRVTSNNYELLPGRTIKKDPVVHVQAGSEDCIVFVKVENGLEKIQKWEHLKDGTPENELVTQMKGYGWVPLTDVKNVFYYKTVVKESTKEIDLPVFDEFTVKESVTNNRDEITSDTDYLPNYKNAKIEVTAYAVQAEGFVTDTLDETEAKKAWEANFVKH